MKKSCGLPIRIALAVFIGLLLFPAAGTGGTHGPPMTAAGQFAFSEHLFQEGEYFRAISEFSRFLFFFPDDDHAAEARLEIARALFQLGQYPESIAAFQKVIETDPDPLLWIPAYLGTARAWRLMGKTAPAKAALHQLIARTGHQEAKDHAHFLLGWMHLEERQWEKAAYACEMIDPSSPLRTDLCTLKERLEKNWRQNRKSPALAGFLSLIPGGGFLYAHQYVKAAGAFLLNGALIWGAAAALADENYALGGLVTFLEAGFYAGNLRGGRGAAEAFNQRLHDRPLKEFQGSLLPGPPPGADTGRMTIGVTIPF